MFQAPLLTSRRNANQAQHKCWTCSCFLGLEAVKRVDLDVLDEGVELVFGILVFVSLSGDSDADFAGDVSDTIDPDESVEASVNTDVFGEHLFGGETLNVTNATGSSLFKLNTVEQLVHVDGVVAAGWLQFGLAHLSLVINDK